VDSSYRQLGWNAARAVVASISTAVLVSGFPLLLGVTSRGEPAALIGELIFAITLTRAPLIVSVMSLQSYFVVRFRDSGKHWVRLFSRVLLIVGGAAVILAVLGAWIGRPVIEWISGHPTPFTAGWLAAAAATIAVMAIPLEVLLRVSLALLVGPVVGIVVHLVSLRTSDAVADVARVPELAGE
jgi:hypothetical protein